MFDFSQTVTDIIATITKPEQGSRVKRSYPVHASFLKNTTFTLGTNARLGNSRKVSKPEVNDGLGEAVTLPANVYQELGLRL